MGDLATTSSSLTRAADVLLRLANGRSVMLRMPAPATAGSEAEQLGLATPEFQDVELAPVIFRKSRARVAANGGKPAALEMVVSASSVNALVGNTGLSSASAMFGDAFGVLLDGALLAIISATELEAGGAICAYRLLLREPVALEV